MFITTRTHAFRWRVAATLFLLALAFRGLYLAEASHTDALDMLETGDARRCFSRAESVDPAHPLVADMRSQVTPTR